MTTFNEYLTNKYMESEHPLDDDIPDGFESWIAEQDIEDVIEWAEKWGMARRVKVGEVEIDGKKYPIEKYIS